MPFETPAPSNKRKKSNKIITDLSNISQIDDEMETEATELDLGTKIKTPKDVMLEELSLLNNRGSKMFKMRQQRVEKFIVTNENMQNLQNLLMSPPPVPPKPTMPKEEVKEETVDDEMIKEEMRKVYVRTYVSPWERAMRGDEELKATMRASMPGPIQIHAELPLYKSFNRSALPFGGYDKASKMLTFELPEASVTAEEPEPLPSLQADLRSRPSFNRTPIGWICSEDNSHIHMDLDTIPFDGETDDLSALPFGGYDKASKMLTFELPEASVTAEEPEPLPSLQADLRSRPSFNRTPIGWICSEDNSHIHMDLDTIPFDGETDDL